MLPLPRGAPRTLGNGQRLMLPALRLPLRMPLLVRQMSLPMPLRQLNQRTAPRTVSPLQRGLMFTKKSKYGSKNALPGWNSSGEGVPEPDYLRASPHGRFCRYRVGALADHVPPT